MTLIDRDELWKTVRSSPKPLTLGMLASEINLAPVIDPDRPVKLGRWIVQDNTYTRFACSECRSKNFDITWPYCPNCGAKMRD